MFGSASISVAISGNNFIENSADFTTKQFFGLNEIFELGINSYHKNAYLINFTFYRCAVVVFTIAIHCLINYDKQYKSAFNGFVLQAFNFAWMIYGIIYLIIKKRNTSNWVSDFDISKRMVYTSYKYTLIWNIMGIFDGIFIICISYFYGIDRSMYFDDILGFLVIVLLNYKLSYINTKQTANFTMALICCFAGIINFIIYSTWIGTIRDVFSLVINLPISYWYLWIIISIMEHLFFY